MPRTKYQQPTEVNIPTVTASTRGEDALKILRKFGVVIIPLNTITTAERDAALNATQLYSNANRVFKKSENVVEKPEIKADVEDKITDPIFIVNTENTVVGKTSQPASSPMMKENVTLEVTEAIQNKRLSFNDNDNVLDMGTNQESIINAPKNVERLDKISKENNERRKLEEEEYDDDEEDKLVIGESIKLDTDILTLEKDLDKTDDLALDDIELLG